MSITPAGLDRLREDVGQLVARHEQRTRTVDFSRYAEDPVGFARDVLKCPRLAKRQVEMMEAVRDNPLTAVQSCNAFGKDHAAGHVALWWAYARQGLVLITSASERQVKEVSMGEVRRAWLRAGGLPGDLYEMALRLDRSEQSGILAFTAADVSRLAGLHAPRVLAILSEAQGLDSWAYEGVLGCATSDDSRVLAIGNPLVSAGRFFDICRSPHWHRIRLSAFDHENVIEGREVIPGAVTQGFVDRIAKEYGTESPIYVARVLGEFPDTADDVLVKREWIRRANDRWNRVVNTDEGIGEPFVFGIDIARYGGDRSVIAVMQAMIVRQFIRLPQKDTMETVGLIDLECKGREIRRTQDGATFGRRMGRLVCDAAGLGAGVHDRLRERGYACVEFNGGRSPTEMDKADFANLRAEAFWKLREALERDEIAIPQNELLEEELCAMRWSVNSAGKIAIESKDLLRERIGRSPDDADALSMAVWEQRRRKMSSQPVLITW